MATTQTKVYTGVKNVPQPDSARVDVVPIDIEFPTAAPVANDLIALIKVPPGVSIEDYAFMFPDIDSNGSPTLAWSFGILNAGNTDLGTVLASGVTVGQSNAIVRCTNSDHQALDVATERRLALKVTTAAATWAGATKTGRFLLSLRG